MDEKNLIEVIKVEPDKVARVTQIYDDLESMQNEVGGMIEEYMPFEDDIALICNEEGKLLRLPPSRGITDENGKLMDIIAGPFFIAYAPIESEKFLSMPENLKEKYLDKFKYPERFFKDVNSGKISAVRYDPAKADLER